MDFLEIDNYDIKNVCLICFNAKYELLYLKSNPAVMEFLQILFQFEVIKPDNFCICRNCIDNLIDSWNFIYLTDNSLNILKTLLHESKVFIKRRCSLFRKKTQKLDFSLLDFKCRSCSQKLNKSFILKNVYKQNLRMKSFKCSSCKKNDESKGNKSKRDSIGFLNVTNIKEEVPDDNVQNVNQSIIETALGCDNNEAGDFDRIDSSFERSTISENGTLCSLCNNVVHDWNSHMREVHMDSTGKRKRKSIQYPKEYKCSICDKWLKSRSSWTAHQRTHTGEKPYVCNYCGKGFAQNSSLKTHMKQHTGRPNKCDICDKSFCRPSELKLHVQKHSGDRPHLCSECGKSFGQKSHLTAHMNIHRLDRPYKCSYCDKNFKERSTLKTHEDIHKEQKRYQCDKCSYKCNKMYRLNEHKKFCTTEKSDLSKKCHCCVCEKGFTSTASLKYHMANEHHVVV